MLSDTICNKYIFRKGWRLDSISKVTCWAITVLVINIGLWVDFITGVGRVRARDRTGWFTDLFKVSTNILLCLFILPYFLVKKGLCRYGDKTKF